MIRVEESVEISGASALDVAAHERVVRVRAELGELELAHGAGPEQRDLRVRTEPHPQPVGVEVEALDAHASAARSPRAQPGVAQPPERR